MLALVEDLPRLEERRRTLAARVAFFRQALTERGLPVMGDAHILSVPVGDEARCRRLAARLSESGVLVLGAIVYPQWPWLSVGCIGVIAAAVLGTLTVTWILTHEREEWMEQ